MGRGANDTLAEAVGTTVPALSRRPAESAYDQDDLLYFSGGHMPPRGLRLLNAGSVYISVHARPDGTIHVLRQSQRPKGRFLDLEPLQIELLYEGRDLDEAARIAGAERREVFDAGLKWDGRSSSDQPTVADLEATCLRLEEIRRRSREHRGPAIVDVSHLERLKEEGWGPSFIETAERARDTNPSAVDRDTLPPRRVR